MFTKVLRPVVAYRPELINQIYHLRHDVYCKELGFEVPRTDELEVDEFDPYSRFCMLQHQNSDLCAGCVRIVSPRYNHDPLPIEKYCGNALKGARIHPSHFRRSEVGEISRLAVRSQYRRRRHEQYNGAAIGMLNERVCSELEMRCFPFIAIGLYFSIASLAVRNNIQHAFVMMEPRLARSMRFIGIRFERLGPTIDYHGRRAAYYINSKMLTDSLPVYLRALMGVIDNEIAKDCLNAKKYARSNSLGASEVERMYSSSHGTEKKLSELTVSNMNLPVFKGEQRSY